MLIEENFTIRAPIKNAWDFITNPEKFASCIPGCEQIKAIDEKTFQCIVKQKVAGISATFNSNISLTAIDPPYHIESIIKGEDMGKSGTMTQKNILDLKEIGKEETEIWYGSDLAVVGRIAIFGERIIKAEAKQIGGEFIRSLRGKMEFIETA